MARRFNNPQPKSSFTPAPPSIARSINSSGLVADSLPPAVHNALGEPGRPLEATTRALMEPHFGHDFSRVRVHTDRQAGTSARALDARAYTVGSDIVFAPGEYQPQTLGGHWLLAHELTHTIQQQGTQPSIQRAPAGLPSTHEEWEATRREAEREADQSADSATPGRDRSREERRPLGKSLAGGIFGGLLGAGAGAAIGIGIGALLGPVGMVVGGILGGLVGGFAGLVAGDVLTADRRELTSGEQQEARKVFGRSLDLSSIRVAEAPFMGFPETARTPFNTIYFPPGATQLPTSQYMPWLIHELTHCWQTQHGISVATKLFYAIQGEGAYKYGGAEQLRADAAAGKRFTQYNTEQQADILSHYYRIRYIEGGDFSAHLPFVQQVNPLAIDEDALIDTNTYALPRETAVA
jgi:hypothetical protein